MAGPMRRRAHALPDADSAGPERGGAGRAAGVVAAARDGPGAGPPGTDRAAGGGGVEQHRDRGGAGHRQAHGRQVARAVRGAPARGPARRAAQRRPAHRRRRAGRRAAGPHPGDRARGRHALEHALHGGRLRPVPGHGAPGLARLRAEAAPGRGLPALQRPGVRGEGARRRRPLPRPAGPRPGPVRRREDRDAGARARPARAADAPRAAGAARLGLRPARDLLALRRPGRGRGPGDRPPLPPAPGGGVPRLPRCGRRRRGPGGRGPPGARQRLASIHKAPAIRDWLARRPRYHLHLTRPPARG
jgi:hypothetical protein